MGIGGRRMNEEKKKAVTALKTTRGQIDGIIKMIEDGRYCIDVSNQIMAAEAGLKRANRLILTQHLNHCVKEAAMDQEKTDEKVAELIDVLNKLLK